MTFNGSNIGADSDWNHSMAMAIYGERTTHLQRFINNFFEFKEIAHVAVELAHSSIVISSFIANPCMLDIKNTKAFAAAEVRWNEIDPNYQLPSRPVKLSWLSY